MTAAQRARGSRVAEAVYDWFEQREVQSGWGWSWLLTLVKKKYLGSCLLSATYRAGLEILIMYALEYIASTQR
jgi:predicted acyltransferase